jgi:hypothetical protein
MLTCGAVGVGVGAGVDPGFGVGDGAGATLTDKPVDVGAAGAVGELPQAIDADAATNAAPDVNPRECFLSLRTT